MEQLGARRRERAVEMIEHPVAPPTRRRRYSKDRYGLKPVGLLLVP
jgi:hypothetical protein